MKRDYLPVAIKRAVRQRCGFGCVMCGAPIFEYEHIEGYGSSGHDPDKMTLLCPNHHTEKTAGRLPVARVRKANQRPVNKSRDLSSNHPLYFDGSTLTVEVGTVKFEWTDVPNASAIEVDGESVLNVSFVDGAISLDLLVRDADNRPLLVVRGGELRHAVGTWDVAFEGKTLIVRRALGDVVIRIKFMPPDRVVIERAEIWCRGVLLRIGKACHVGSGIEVANNGHAVFDTTVKNRRTLLAVGDYLGSEGQILTTWVPQRWLGGIPVGSGSFSRKGGGQKQRYTNPDYLEDCLFDFSRVFRSVCLPDNEGLRHLTENS